MKIDKVKKFCRKHKTKLAFLAGASLVCLGGIVGVLSDKANKTKFYKEHSYKVLSVLDDYLSKPRGDSKVFGGAHTSGFKPSELGEIGNAMLELGCPTDQKFTHFIAIGEAKN